MKSKKNKNEFHSDFSVGKVRIGGEKSEIPSVLIASIFYMRHKIVKNEILGTIDEIEAGRLIDNCQKLSDRYGVGLMLDVIASTEKALVNYIKFIKGISDVPVLINSSNPEVRIEALKKLVDLGLHDGIVYNSINSFGTDKELECLASLPIDTAVVQAYSVKLKNPNGPLKALLGDSKNLGIIEKVRKTGIKKIMVDIPILDLSSIGLVSYSTKIIKEALSVPVGTAPANAAYSTEWLKDRRNITLDQFRMINASLNVYLIANGSNFLFFGPIENADMVFPACALADAMNVYGARHLGFSPISDSHPMYFVL